MFSRNPPAPPCGGPPGCGARCRWNVESRRFVAYCLQVSLLHWYIDTLIPSVLDTLILRYLDSLIPPLQVRPPRPKTRYDYPHGSRLRDFWAFVKPAQTIGTMQEKASWKFQKVIFLKPKLRARAQIITFWRFGLVFPKQKTRMRASFFKFSTMFNYF